MATKLDRLMFYDREDRPWAGPRLTSAAIVGHTTQTSTRIWVRVWEPGQYRLLVSPRPVATDSIPGTKGPAAAEVKPMTGGAPRRVDGQMLSAKIGYSTDLTHVFDVDGLAPGERYYYAVFRSDDPQRRERWEIGRDEVHSFRTMPVSSDRVAFGLYSCHNPFKGRAVLNMHMWDSFRDVLSLANADFVIGAGDQAYADGDKRVNIWDWLKGRKDDLLALSKKKRLEVMSSWYRDIYRGYWGDLAVRRVYRAFPQYMIWDDHEIMDGWGSYTKEELSDHLDSIWEWENQGQNLELAYDMFEAAKIVYREYEHSHNPPTNDGEWDYSFEAGLGLAFYVLDMRGVRDFGRASHKILGAAQLQRFTAWLDARRADASNEAVFIVSAVPVIHVSAFIANVADLTLLGLADDLRDEWEHESNWEERNWLLDRVFAFSAETGRRVAFLSGDVHIGAAFRLTRKSCPDARIYQLTSSGITYAKAPGKLLKLVVRQAGELGDSEGALPDGGRTSFTRLHVFEENNFGLIHAWRNEAQRLELAWDLYGSTGQDGEIVRLRRISLPGK